jgi:choline dehydrogenase-like flavoprotein
VDKKLTKEDRLKLDKGTEHARRVLKNAGATDIYRGWMFAAHPGGTAKIGEHLDTNLKTKFDNLYVCDCSVIPQELGLPPTTTILSLGKRLAKHLLAMDQPVKTVSDTAAMAHASTDLPEDPASPSLIQ